MHKWLTILFILFFVNVNAQTKDTATTRLGYPALNLNVSTLKVSGTLSGTPGTDSVVVVSGGVLKRISPTYYGTAGSSSRFGVSGEDATAAQHRSFTHSGYFYSLFAAAGNKQTNFIIQDSTIKIGLRNQTSADLAFLILYGNDSSVRITSSSGKVGLPTNLPKTTVAGDSALTRGADGLIKVAALPTGTVTSASVVSANGFAGSVATATTTPAITVSTTITGILKGNGTAISAATGGTDYQTAQSVTGMVKSSGTTRSAATAETDYTTPTGTGTLSNKRWTPRVGSTTSSATPTINTDNVDIYKLTAQTAAITSFTTNLTGTPVDGDILEIQITGTAARAITWGSSFVSSTVTLPTTTVTTATLTAVFQFYTTSSYGNNKWVCVNSF